jgi:ABC-type transport system substrate-binding protein
MTISSLEERALLYQEMDQMIMEYYPIVPLYYDQAIRFVQKGISGFEMNPLNLLQLKKVRKN